MKFLRLAFTFLLILLAVFLYRSSSPRQPAKNPDPNHTHADFAVWLGSAQLDFSKPKYMSDEPGAGTGAKANPVVHDKYIHLHDGNGHVVHFHKPGLTLGAFFTSLGFRFTGDCLRTDDGRSFCASEGKKVRLFVNGAEQSGPVAAYAPKDLDHLLLTTTFDPVELRKELASVTNDACLYSQTCPERGKAPTEHCIADPAVPCVE